MTRECYMCGEPLSDENKTEVCSQTCHDLMTKCRDELTREDVARYVRESARAAAEREYLDDDSEDDCPF